MIVGCYTLDVYCDNEDKCAAKDLPIWDKNYLPWPCQYTGRNSRECLQAAKSAGWKIKRDVAICAICLDRKRMAREESK